DNWERLDGNGLPSGFGFPIMLDPGNADRAWVIPEEGAENRVTAGGRLGVWRTDDGGASWSLDAEGRPEQAWAAIKREASAWDEDGPGVGTQSGAVWARERGGAGRRRGCRRLTGHVVGAPNHWSSRSVGAPSRRSSRSLALRSVGAPIIGTPSVGAPSRWSSRSLELQATGLQGRPWSA